MLTQQEADVLMRMPKAFSEPDPIMFPNPGEDLRRDLISTDGRERFILDVSRGSIKVSKCTYQERARAAFVLVRVDLDGPPHTNPDGTSVQCPHIHLYREGYHDKWAEPLPSNHFTSSGSVIQVLGQFLRYCHVVDLPEIQGTLIQ